MEHFSSVYCNIYSLPVVSSNLQHYATEFNRLFCFRLISHLVIILCVIKMTLFICCSNYLRSVIPFISSHINLIFYTFYTELTLHCITFYFHFLFLYFCEYHYCLLPPPPRIYLLNEFIQENLNDLFFFRFFRQLTDLLNWIDGVRGMNQNNNSSGWLYQL